MNVIGTSTEWADLIDPMVAMIFDLAVATWEGMPSPNSDDGEDKITTALCRALQQNRTARGLMFQIARKWSSWNPRREQTQGGWILFSFP